MLLQDRAALVTGGAQGIGRAIASCFVREGARVMLADVNVALAEQVAAELRASGARAAAHGIDLQRVTEIPGLVAHTVRHLGRLDVLVNNAGVEFGEPFFEVTQDTWDTHLNVNLRAMFFHIHRLTDGSTLHQEAGVSATRISMRTSRRQHATVSRPIEKRVARYLYRE